MLPCLITYFKEDMTIKQIIIQRIVDFFVLDASIIAVLYYIFGDIPGKREYITIFVSIFILPISYKT